MLNIHRISKLLFVLALFILFGFGCNNQKASTKNDKTTVSNDNNKAKIPNDFFLSVERTPCYGTCATYKAEVDAKGVVNYYGKRFVANIGSFTKTLKDADLKSLYTLMSGANFSQFQENYDDPGVSDLPTFMIEYQANGKRKKVTARAKYPKELGELLVAIEEKIGKEGYVKKEDKK